MPLRTKLVVLASLLAVASATGELRVRVASSSGGGPTTSSELHATTLGEAADLVAAHLAVSSRDVTVELAPGAHRVPLGGLKLDASHTPADRNHKVVWKSEVGARTSVTGEAKLDCAAVQQSRADCSLTAAVPCPWGHVHRWHTSDWLEAYR